MHYDLNTFALWIGLGAVLIVGGIQAAGWRHRVLIVGLIGIGVACVIAAVTGPLMVNVWPSLPAFMSGAAKNPSSWVALVLFIAALILFAPQQRISPSNLFAALKMPTTARDVRVDLNHLLTWAVNRIGANVLEASLLEKPKTYKDAAPSDLLIRNKAIGEMNRWLAETEQKIVVIMPTKEFKLYIRIAIRAASERLKEVPPETIGSMNAFEFGEFYLKVCECEAVATELRRIIERLNKDERNSFDAIIGQLNQRKKIN